MGSTVAADQVEIFDLLRPNVVPPKPETYFCTPIRIDSETDYYIVGFIPNATLNTAHHMLVYGCEEPGSDEEVWSCGEMSNYDRSVQSAPVCRTGAQVIYAWAHHAPPLQLPKDVGFHVGGRSKIKYLSCKFITPPSIATKTELPGMTLEYSCSIRHNLSQRLPVSCGWVPEDASKPTVSSTWTR